MCVSFSSVQCGCISDLWANPSDALETLCFNNAVVNSINLDVQGILCVALSLTGSLMNVYATRAPPEVLVALLPNTNAHTQNTMKA